MMKTLLLLLTFSSFTLAQEAGQKPKPPADWEEWAKWAEKQHPVTDSQGHGPDIGGDEWANALARRLGIIDADGHGPDARSDEWRAAIENKLTAKAEPAGERSLLSYHDTEATFSGLKDHTCMGRTALCPDRCGHSGKLATFGIVRYLDYQKPGEFGDPKQKEFMVLIEDNHGNAKVPAAIRDTILKLKPGAAVRLKWNHDYVTREGASFPERPIILLEERKK